MIKLNTIKTIVKKFRGILLGNAFKTRSDIHSSGALVGADISVGRFVEIDYIRLLTAGINVVIGDKVKVNARAGVLIGDGSTIEKGVKLNTVKDGFSPIVIAPNTVVSKTTKFTDGFIGNFENQVRQDSVLNKSNQFFVVSTGRSGSQAIAKNLRKHSQISCFHDAFAHINVFVKKQNSSDSYNVEKSLHDLFNSISVPEVSVLGQSDQKLSLVIPQLSKLFPQAKFIWLLREADSFVNTAYSRGWYLNREFGYSSNKKEFFTAEVQPSYFDATHRLSGVDVGQYKENEWKEMTAFERICWYWSWLNTKIEYDLESLGNEKFIKVKLNELNDSMPDIFEFLGLENEKIEVERTNKARYKKIKKQEWSDEMKQLYNKHCSHNMKKWF